MEKLNNAIDIVKPLITAISGTLVGLALPFYFNDFIRPFFSSVRIIRSRIYENKPLGKKETKRIQKFARNRLDEWINKLRSPNNSSSYDSKLNYVPLPYLASNSFSYCPNNQIHIYFDSTRFIEDIIQSDNINLIIKKFESYLNTIDSEDKISKKLFNLLEIWPQLIVWIKIPTYIVESEEKLFELYNQLEVTVKSWFPAAKLKLELFIPKIIFNELNKIEIDNNNVISNFHFQAAKLTYLQDLTASILSKKCIFGKLELDENRRIPEDIIKSKLKDYPYQDTVQFLNVFGYPGSGKTELLNYIIWNEIKKESNTSIICFDSIEYISSINSYYGKYDSFIDFILNIINLNDVFDCPEEEFSIIKKIYKQILQERIVDILIVIDNLEYSESLSNDLQKLASSKGFSNVRFLIASRNKQKEYKKTINLQYIKCELWNYDDALRIVKSWNNSIDCVTNKPWLKDSNSLSTYLLRIISSNDEDIEPNELVKHEIDSILAPISNRINSAKINSDEQIIEIKKLIEENNLSKETVLNIFQKEKELDLIKIIGNITWSRIYKFQQYEFGEEYGLNIQIIPERVVKWSRNQITDINTAQMFINACKDSGIIKNRSLTDKLIQDGTAAITIQEEFIRKYLLLENDPEEQQKIEGVIHNLISNLSKKNSLEIFKLSFSVNNLLVITFLRNFKF